MPKKKIVVAEESDVILESSGKPPRVQSVARAAAILYAIAKDDRGLSRKNISATAKLSKQITYHLLHTLSQSGLVTRNDEGNYILGLRVGRLAEGFQRQLSGLAQVSGIVREISRKTGETTYSAKWINGEVVSVDIVRGRFHIQALELPPGFAQDAHSRAGGKVLLAYASEEKRREYFKTHRLKRRTPNTTISVKKLEEQFQTILAQGYAVEQEEFAVGLSCVGMPLDGGLSPYAIGISAPTPRFNENFHAYLDTLRKVIAEHVPND
jgi:IclR family acetate operon transcriptional repressor